MVRPAALEAVLAVVAGDASPIVVVAVVGLGVVHSVRALPGLKTQTQRDTERRTRVALRWLIF